MGDTPLSKLLNLDLSFEQRKEKAQKDSPQVGESVIYVDEYGHPHFALVSANWGGTTSDAAAINLLYVSLDETKRDPYGRQIERMSSVVPGHVQAAHGRYYLRPEDWL